MVFLKLGWSVVSMRDLSSSFLKFFFHHVTLRWLSTKDRARVCGGVKYYFPPVFSHTDSCTSPWVGLETHSPLCLRIFAHQNEFLFGRVTPHGTRALTRNVVYPEIVWTKLFFYLFTITILKLWQMGIKFEGVSNLKKHLMYRLIRITEVWCCAYVLLLKYRWRSDGYCC